MAVWLLLVHAVAGATIAPPAHAAAVTLSPAVAVEGSAIGVRGAGFPARRRGSIRLAGRAAARIRTDGRGRFYASVRVEGPPRRRALRLMATAGGRRVGARLQRADGAAPTLSAAIHWSDGRRLALSRVARSGAKRLRIRGSGFRRGERLRLLSRGRPVRFLRAGPKGGVSAAVRVRGSTPLRLVVVSRRRAIGVRLAAARRRLPGRPGPSLPPTPPPDPVLAAAGDIACPPGPAAEGCGHVATAALLQSLAPAAIAALGDLQYPDGALAHFRASFEPSWGRLRPLLRPVPGNHEYQTKAAAGYFAYFGAAAGDASTGYYSYDLGAWHIVALNSSSGCSPVPCAAGSAQERWLRADLAAHPSRCVLAYWHHPRFSSGAHGDEPAVRDLWRALHEAGADVVLAGHDHDYERFAPQDPEGRADPARGLRQFVVGTGGAHLRALGKPRPNSEVRDATSHGVLALTLRPAGYDWRFVPAGGGRFTDSGSGACH